MQLINRNTVHPLRSGEPFFIQSLKDSATLSDSSIRWGGLCFGGNILIMLVLVLLMLPVVGSAETEVEGEVSGVWDVEGSPYIVVDSTWVPEDESLTLLEGVIVMFEENQGLYVYGSLDATGSEEDSVYIRVNEDVEHWRGLRFYDRNQTEWNYASIICPDSAIVLDPNCTLMMENCLVDADRTIAGDTGNNNGIEDCNLAFSQSIIRSRSYHYAVGGSLTADHTLFDLGGDNIEEPGFHTWWTSFRLTSCEVVGVLGAQDGIVHADSCRFLRTPLGRSTGVGIGLGRMTESYVEGGASAGRIFTQTVVTFRNNILLGHLNLSGCVNVSGCDIGGLFDIDDCESVSIRNSVIRGSLLIDRNNSVTIDSCFIVSDDTTRNRFHARSMSNLTVTRSVLILYRISVSNVEEVLFDHNTIVFDPERAFAIGAHPSSFTNNIIMRFDPGGQLFSSFEYELPGFEYNCVWGFDSYIGHPDSAVTELDSTNVIANPLIGWDGNIPYISYNSPCRDAGDPDSPLDPDSTRADIGAYYFDYQTVFKDSGEIHPTGFTTYPAYPNPFNASVSVRFQTAKSSRIQANIFDLNGRKIFTLPVDYYLPGSHVITWETHSLNVPSGEYLFQINGEKTSKAARVVLIR